ncbi:hypothetical protein JKP88DRAFT_204283 [Tribonema minus]|uniref:DUF4336 domain-containing protein n=1 Tax=Tribonema minus TaxID=303371 RepID=A0A835ZG26_9STRA|nr:hypothetical protein JKP88DRAFT_204283 [Tribonema minus]
MSQTATPAPQQAAPARRNARDKTWSNPKGLDLTPIKHNVWGAERPFIWNTIDVGGRMTVIKLEDGSLWVHSPVELDPALQQTLAELGPVRHVVSPNYEHVKYAQQWIHAYPDATAWACPGLKDKKPDIGYDRTIGTTADAPADWPREIGFVWLNCERVPVLNQAFFSEVVFHHEPSQCLLCTDVYWNYPRSAPPKTQLWKFGMDVVYLPIYRNLLVADAREFDKLLARIDAWNFNTVVPCHGRVVMEAARDKFFAFLRRGVIGDQP